MLSYEPWVMSTRVALALLALPLLFGCRSSDGDPPSDVDPSPLGTGSTLRSLQDPESEDKIVVDPPASCGRTFSTPVNVTGTVVNWVDRYNEATNSDATGTVWVQDFGSKEPWSGTSFFSPSFVPSSLTVNAGDVIDFRGLYQENVCIGATVNFQQDGGNAVLAQVATPTVGLRFDGPPIEPTEIPLSDLTNFDTGRKWIGMLVTVRDVRVTSASVSNGRVTWPFSRDRNAPGLSNEFRRFEEGEISDNVSFASVTGVVTWFFSFKIASRYPSDLVRAQ